MREGSSPRFATLAQGTDVCTATHHAVSISVSHVYLREACVRVLLPDWLAVCGPDVSSSVVLEARAYSKRLRGDSPLALSTLAPRVRPRLLSAGYRCASYRPEVCYQLSLKQRSCSPVPSEKCGFAIVPSLPIGNVEAVRDQRCVTAISLGSWGASAYRAIRLPRILGVSHLEGRMVMISGLDG